MRFFWLTVSQRCHVVLEHPEPRGGRPGDRFDPVMEQPVLYLSTWGFVKNEAKNNLVSGTVGKRFCQKFSNEFCALRHRHLYRNIQQK